jgi:hypothetical protein
MASIIVRGFLRQREYDDFRVVPTLIESLIPNKVKAGWRHVYDTLPSLAPGTTRTTSTKILSCL